MYCTSIVMRDLKKKIFVILALTVTCINTQCYQVTHSCMSPTHTAIHCTCMVSFRILHNQCECKSVPMFSEILHNQCECDQFGYEAISLNHAVWVWFQLRCRLFPGIWLAWIPHSINNQCNQCSGILWGKGFGAASLINGHVQQWQKKKKRS